VKPYWMSSDGRLVIYHGDTLEVMNALPDEPLTAFVTDPPYSSGNLPEAMKVRDNPRLRGWRWEGKTMETDQLSTIGFVWLMRAVCLEARERLVPGGSALIFIDWRNWGNLVGTVESTGLRVNNMVVWDKTSIGMGNGFRNQHELILYASKGAPYVVSHAVPNVIQSPRAPNDDHQSPKPISLMRRLLTVVAAPGDLVLDPFMGSGSTLAAAALLGQRAIGIEIEERYCEIAARRLEDPPMLAAVKAEQMTLEVPA
jgi:DNA modification methylase